LSVSELDVSDIIEPVASPRTCKSILQLLDLTVSLSDDGVELLIDSVVFFSEIARQVGLIDATQRQREGFLNSERETRTSLD
jgi:hypothetical protein